MAIFTKDKELQENFDALKKDHEDTQATLEKRESEVKELTQKLATAEDSNKETTGKLETAEADLATANKSIEGLKADLAASEEKQSDFDSKVSAAALAKMAELGVKEPVEGDGEGSDSGNLYDQYCELKKSNPAAAGAFWRKNEAQIKSLK